MVRPCTAWAFNARGQRWWAGGATGGGGASAEIRTSGSSREPGIRKGSFKTGRRAFNVDFSRDTSVVSGKGADGNVTEELFVLNLLLCGPVPRSGQGSLQHLHPPAGGAHITTGPCGPGWGGGQTWGSKAMGQAVRGGWRPMTPGGPQIESGPWGLGGHLSTGPPHPSSPDNGHPDPHWVRETAPTVPSDPHPTMSACKWMNRTQANATQSNEAYPHPRGNECARYKATDVGRPHNCPPPPKPNQEQLAAERSPTQLRTTPQTLSAL